MKSSLFRLLAGRKSAQQLRREIRHGQGSDLRLRRAAICTSLLGMTSMAVVTLYQTGILRRLADPPIRGFASEKVNSSDTAWGYGIPDGTLTLLAHAANVTLAAAGGEDRSRMRSYLPILAAGAAGLQAAVAAKYLFYQMPSVEKAWCPYCIVDATAHLVTFGLTLPEACKAARTLVSGSRS